MAWQDRGYYRDSGSEVFQPGGISITRWLIIINIVVFVLDMVLEGSGNAHRMAPSVWGNFNIPQAVGELQVWRWVSYQFIHAGFFHIFFNMWALYSFGPIVEQWWGTKRYLGFYLFCGTSGAMLFTLLAKAGVVTGWNNPGVGLVGASGSIFGLLMATAKLAPHAQVMVMLLPMPIQLRTLAWIFMGIAVLSIGVNAQNAGGEAAHLGGAVMGLVLMYQPGLLGWLQSGTSKPTRRSGGSGGFSLTGSWQTWQEKRRQETLAKDEAEVDRILAKVKDKGLHSLTEAEKMRLQRASARKRGEE